MEVEGNQTLLTLIKRYLSAQYQILTKRRVRPVAHCVKMFVPTAIDTCMYITFGVEVAKRCEYKAVIIFTAYFF